MPQPFDKLAMLRKLEADGSFTHAQAGILAECFQDMAVCFRLGDPAVTQRTAVEMAQETERPAIPVKPRKGFGYIQFGFLGLLAIALIVLCYMFNI